MARDVTDTTPITSRDELVGWLEAGSKGAEPLKLGCVRLALHHLQPSRIGRQQAHVASRAQNSKPSQAVPVPQQRWVSRQQPGFSTL